MMRGRRRLSSCGGGFDFWARLTGVVGEVRPVIEKATHLPAKVSPH